MSFPSSLELKSFPVLNEWLAQRYWTKFFQDTAIQRSSAYLNDGSILSIELQQDGEEQFTFTAFVRGSDYHPYEVRIEVHSLELRDLTSFSLTSECSCPVFHQCKHAAAALGRLTLIAKVAGPPARRSTAIATSQEGLSREASSWLDSLQSASIQTKPSKPKANTNFLAYCIEPCSSADGVLAFRLVLRPANRLRSGLVRIKDSEAKADPSRPASYVTDEDIPLIARFRGLQSSLYQEAPLAGPDWLAILEAALKLGRLYFSPTAVSYDSTADHVLLSSGPPVPAEATWETLESSGARPIVRLAGPHLILIPCHPPCYIDPQKHLIGSIESELPAAVLTTWPTGPIIHPDEIPALSQRLASLPKASDLPAPVDLPTEILTPSLPQAHLEIRKESVGEFRNPDSLIGVLTFRYQGSPPLLPLSSKQSSTTSWVEGGKRFIVERNRLAEKTHEKELLKRGLAPLHKTVPLNRLKAAFRQAFTVAKPYPTIEASWIRFIADHADRLRATGWAIELSESSGLLIHELDEFTPVIAQHGDQDEDWFEFELSGEVEGKAIPLMPYVADAIQHGLVDLESDDIPESFLFRGNHSEDGHLRLPGPRFIETCRNLAHLFHGTPDSNGPALRVDRLAAAGIAASLEIDSSETSRALAQLGSRLRDLTGLPETELPEGLKAELRPYQLEGFRWLRFLAENQLHGILADDMGLGKTIQTLAHLATDRPKRSEKRPSLVIAPTSVITNWAEEAARFTPDLKVLLLQGPGRSKHFDEIPEVDLVLTSYPLLVRDHQTLVKQHWHTLVLDEAQYIKNPKTAAAQQAFKLLAEHRLCLSGTPMENHLGELWSLMRFLMPGFLPDEKSFTRNYRRPIERDRDPDAQTALNRRISPLILRRTKDQVASDLPPKTHLLHRISLSPKETELYESVRGLMDKRVRDAVAEQGLARSQIVVLDSLLKLRQICCHPSLLKNHPGAGLDEASKLDFLTRKLLPTLIEEGRRILIFSQFTSVLELIESHLKEAGIDHLKLTGQSRNRSDLVKTFQSGEVPIFLISLKAGGTGLNLTAADTVIHYDPWWNPAAENQASDRAHRIGQTKPVFIHKLICENTIEDRILKLQEHKSTLVEALLSEETTKLKLDAETLSHLLAPLG